MLEKPNRGNLSRKLNSCAHLLTFPKFVLQTENKGEHLFSSNYLTSRPLNNPIVEALMYTKYVLNTPLQCFVNQVHLLQYLYC